MMICVYGSFSPNVPEEKLQPYMDLGERLGEKYDLIYGGGAHSTLGYFAKGMRKAGAKVIGVYPKAFEGMSIYKECTEVIKCDTMAERKQTFEKSADIFIVLPGGVGTMDELFETIVLIEKDMLKGKVIILNENGFYDTLLKFMDEMKEKGMFHCDLSQVYQVVNSFEELEEIL
jgi:hypothetical protein